VSYYKLPKTHQKRDHQTYQTLGIFCVSKLFLIASSTDVCHSDFDEQKFLKSERVLPLGSFKKTQIHKGWCKYCGTWNKYYGDPPSGSTDATY
jgi:hypothetical protein